MNTWLEISKSALRDNILNFSSLLAKEVKLMAVIKSNAYGHGLIKVAQIIQNSVDYLVVMNADEAQKLRENEIHIPILILGYTKDKDEILWSINERIEVAIQNKYHAEELSKILEKEAKVNDLLRVHINVDTGMWRMGVLSQEALDLIKYVQQIPKISIRGIMSHFSSVVGHREYSKKQLQKFQDVKFQLYKETISNKSSQMQNYIWHIANTEAILGFPESHMDAVRLGVGLYGLWPDKRLAAQVRAINPDFNLKPVLTWKAKIIQIKNCPKGEYIGYGCTHKTSRKTRIAIIPVGYYEGYDRKFSNKGKVIIGSEKCKILGRVCMNIIIVDITNLQGVKVGDEAILIGSSCGNTVTADEKAREIDTNNYEIITRINLGIKRIIVD